MPNYQEGKIYKIYSPSDPTNMIYVGSTSKSLHTRFSNHKGKCVLFFTDTENEYCASFEIISQYTDTIIELIKTFPCNSKKELEIEEGNVQLDLINKDYNVINFCIAGGLLSEYNNKKKMQKYKAKPWKCPQCSSAIMTIGGKYKHIKQFH